MRSPSSYQLPFLYTIMYLMCIRLSNISYQGCKKILSIRTGGRFSGRKDNQSNISTYCCWFITHRRHYFLCLSEFILIKWLFLNYILVQQWFFSLYSSYKCKSMGYRLDLYPCKLHDCMYGVQKISCCSQK